MSSAVMLRNRRSSASAARPLPGARAMSPRPLAGGVVWPGPPPAPALRRPSGFLAEHPVVDVFSAEIVVPLCSLLLQDALYFGRKTRGGWLRAFQLVEVRGVELIERLQLKLREAAIVVLLVPISPIGDLLVIREQFDLGLFL